MNDAEAGPYVMLTAPGVLRAFGARRPDDAAQGLQSLLGQPQALTTAQWLALAPDVHAGLFASAIHHGWMQQIGRALSAPAGRLDSYLPHAIAGLSATRNAALASQDGFCLARVGYDATTADALCAAAADFLAFEARQKDRGWAAPGRIISFHDDVNVLLPKTTFVRLWIDAIAYWLVIGDEPLLNNNALVELAWGLKVAATRFDISTEPRG